MTTGADDLFRRNLGTVRRARGYSLAGLSRALDTHGIRINHTGIYKMEAGQRRTTIGEAATLCLILEISLRDMVTRELEPKVTF